MAGDWQRTNPRRRKNSTGWSLCEVLESRLFLSGSTGVLPATHPPATAPQLAAAARPAATNPRAYDAGDFKYYHTQKIRFLRATDQVLVGVKPGVDLDAATRSLMKKGRPLAGYQVLKPLNDTTLRFARAVGVGAKHFRVLERHVQAFGYVKWVGPSFILDSGDRAYVTDEISVSFKPGITPSGLLGSEVLSAEFMGPYNTYNLTLGVGGIAALQRANQLNGDPNVIWAEPSLYQAIHLQAPTTHP
jgi:hypothetical protein